MKPEVVTPPNETRFFCDPKIETDSPAVPITDKLGHLSLAALGLINALVTPEYRIVAHYGSGRVVTDSTDKKVGAPEIAPSDPSSVSPEPAA